MQLCLYLLTTALFLTQPVFGDGHAFVIQDVDSNQLLVQEGDISERLSPYCTFNLALSLIGFDTAILTDTHTPEWPFREEHREEYLSWNDSFPEKWAVPHHPQNWMKNSCVWFSQTLSQLVGMDLFAEYVAHFDYGNKNLMGDEGKANGLTRAWIGSSLRISPVEQVHFINRLLKYELPVSVSAVDLTKEILFIEELPNGMSLYGKTGSGVHGKGQDTYYRVGWFVGWVEKDNRKFSFAYLVHGTESGDHLTGLFAKELLKQRLLQLKMHKE